MTARTVRTRRAMDGNTAAADVVYRTSEVCAIYPITPSSTMAELADQWAAEGRKNLWGSVPVVQEMQSEGGAAGAVHGALQAGALTTTFTASQGLLLMLPNMFKIAGELTPTVFHVAARSVASHALSIFGDHSDVMAVRPTGFALFCSGSVQEAHDGALITLAATLESRVPFLHFFDGFRTSHEVNTLDLLADEQLRALIPDELVRAHRSRALNPEHPFIRGTAHNPDTFFQAREAASPFYSALPRILRSVLDRFAAQAGRRYRLFEYDGPEDAERVIVLMGSGAETARETASALRRQGEPVGVLQVRLFRPFAAEEFLSALPLSCRSLAVLERTKEPGAPGEPLFLDVLGSLAEAYFQGKRPHLPRVIGGRYGLSSKDLTPAMAKAVFDELRRPEPKSRFTVGITDDVSQSSLEVDPGYSIEPDSVVRALFYGLGGDGTVGANKHSIQILAEEAGLHAQGYFVYDSHKSGALTVSHLRFGPEPIHSPYLVSSASVVACHWFPFLERVDVLRSAAPGAVFLLNSPYGPESVWDHLPRSIQRQILEKRLRLHVIDASRIAREAGLKGRTNTVLQTAFFALAGILARDEAVEQVRQSIRKAYGGKGEKVVAANLQAVDHALANLHEVIVPKEATSAFDRRPWIPPDAPEFLRLVTGPMLEGRGDEIPVSLFPVDGTYPSGTAALEKRNVADFVPIWEPAICVQCGQCGFVCPHSVIRVRYYDEARLDGSPPSFRSAPINLRGYPGVRFTLQVYVEDCTGCGLCVDVCPAYSPVEPEKRAIHLEAKQPVLEAERENIAFFERLPVNDRSHVDFANVRGVQFLEPLFEFSGACAGCGETPYLKLLSQLFGDRLLIANATGCSSIYGGNLPVTPWAKNGEGRGPAWSNSLFEDNAEFGFGFRLAADQLRGQAEELLRGLAGSVGEELTREILSARQIQESEIRAQRRRLEALRGKLASLAETSPHARELLSVMDHLVRRSIWLVGGDGWAYDIGFGGLDHVLATGRNVNVLVLDTEVYSNTGGQASKATPLGAVAKFAAAGKREPRKDLVLQAIAYGNVYVAQVAMGANPQQTLLAFREAEAYEGPSLILAYSHCIAHGIEMERGLRQQDAAVACGYWPLLRFNPAMRAIGENPFRLDSPRPTLPFSQYANQELRYRALGMSHPADAAALAKRAQTLILEKYQIYEQLAGLREGKAPVPVGAEAPPPR
ncbi:pyruvate:ferredoxin (flavodoxin) oxidoreductase [Verrucomicrobium sp. 3C]|uniref:pyruvate:ferredoxin (flavodoxin) oxidoreductase n=1 Tax=Verrucomicrobium sp. 3C TaxID=1134055 RepID=UPI0003A21FA4|nr:pyruvate:ferredoxin (flavodoxin) oxidoreductase [Verrucomicrobium sp. 3C]